MPEDPELDSVRVGEVLGGKYRVVRLLGEGGMGAVYEAENTWTTRRVAIKLLRAQFAGDRSVVERFRVEAVAATKLSHPHIVDVLDMGQDDATGALFLVQEFLEGRDLRAHLDAAGRLPVAEAVDLLVPIVAALVTAHEAGILHRDLKPENIFLVRTPGGDLTPKLIDFGLARIESDSPTRMTRTGSIMGTPYYMSPEQARGDKSVDGRADVWAIATVLYELLAGRPPFDAPTYNLLIYRILSETPPRVEVAAPEVPRALGDVIRHALTPDLDARTPDMRAFLEELLACPYLDGEIDSRLRERHRRVLPATATPAPIAPSAARDEHALSRTLTPAELDAPKAPAAVPAPVEVTRAPTPYGWDRPSQPQPEEPPPPRARSRRGAVAALALTGGHGVRGVGARVVGDGRLGHGRELHLRGDGSVGGVGDGVEGRACGGCGDGGGGRRGASARREPHGP